MLVLSPYPEKNTAKPYICKLPTSIARTLNEKLSLCEVGRSEWELQIENLLQLLKLITFI